MAQRASVADLLSDAALAVEPAFPDRVQPRLGGVDPLGLRQINFDLMDQVFPGLNNVARHIRPFVVTTWAWRRAARLAKNVGEDRIPTELLRDFVDRIEVIYVWSQILRDRDVDLPGRDVLQPLIKAGRYKFGGDEWSERRKTRKYSTAFTAPITYGPALKTLGWLQPHEKNRDILIPCPEVDPALDGFEKCIEDRLEHAAFREFGEIELTTATISEWKEGWSLNLSTSAERKQLEEMPLGARAPSARRCGARLAIIAADRAGTEDVARVRAMMADDPTELGVSGELAGSCIAWRRVQVRQLFRLALECLLYWVIHTLERGALSTQLLVESFMTKTSRQEVRATGEWFDSPETRRDSPVALLERLEAAAQEERFEDLPARIVDALVLTLAEAPDKPETFERTDRLPLYRARKEAEVFRDARPQEFLRHVLESWVFAQHVYWSVGRGLADARARGKSILRLKVVLEEGGWTLAPGALRQNPPVPTPDRLRTALSLLREGGLVGRGDPQPKQSR